MKKLNIILPLILIFLAFIIYLKTMPPSILWVDSGTMIAASYTLGIPNPPGFPFYMMVSHLFSILPFFKVITRLEIFTIIFSLGTLFLVYRVILFILVVILSKAKDLQNDIFVNLSAFFGAIALAFSYQYWSQSQNTEAFIFTYFFVALFTYLLLPLLASKGDAFRGRILFLVAFLYGLAAGANPTVAALVPGVIFVMFLNRKFLNIKKLIVLGLVFAITISLVYSYLPIRAKSYPFVNWGNPQTIELFVDHLHGKGLNIYEPESGSINGFTGSPEVFFQSVSYAAYLSLIQFTPFLFPFILLGMYFVFKKSKKLFLFLISVPFIDVFYSGLYYSGNQESWLILTWMFLAVFMGVGFYAAVRSSVLGFRFSDSGLSVISQSVKTDKQITDKQVSDNRQQKTDNRRFIILFFLSFLPLLVWFVPLNRSGHNYTSDYAKNLYSSLEKNAIVLGTGDFFNSMSHYLHEADKFREDVIPVTVNVFYVNKWYRDTLRNATDIKVADDLEKIIQYKSFSEYNEAMNKFIQDNIDKRPIYATHLSLRASALAATTGGQLKLDERFKFVPNGLSLKIVRASDPAEPKLSSFDFKFKSDLSKPPFYLERNYKGGFKNIINDYVYSYEALGDYYADRQDYDMAYKYYKKAEEIEPDNAELLAHFGEFYAKRKDFNASYQYLRKAAMLSPKNVFIHFNLGLSYMNLGRNEEAKQAFEAVKALVPVGDPIAVDADNMIKNLSKPNITIQNITDETKEWLELKDKENNLYVKIPKDIRVVKAKKYKGYEFSLKKELSISLLGQRLSENQKIEDLIKESPIVMDGNLLDTKEITMPGFFAWVQIFGSPNGSSLRYVLAKEDWVWQFKVAPGDSKKMDVFTKILNTFGPYKR